MLGNKGFEFCYQCPEYNTSSCEKFEKLAEGYLKEDGVDVRANLERIRKGDVDGWLKESKERFSCPQCGKPLSTHTRVTRCYHCSKKLSTQKEF